MHSLFRVQHFFLWKTSGKNCFYSFCSYISFILSISQSQCMGWCKLSSSPVFNFLLFFVLLHFRSASFSMYPSTLFDFEYMYFFVFLFLRYLNFYYVERTSQWNLVNILLLCFRVYIQCSTKIVFSMVCSRSVHGFVLYWQCFCCIQYVECYRVL